MDGIKTSRDFRELDSPPRGGAGAGAGAGSGAGAEIAAEHAGPIVYNSEPWTHDEVKNLIQIRDENSTEKWSDISAKIGNARSPIDCQNIYSHFTNPDHGIGEHHAIPIDTLFPDDGSATAEDVSGVMGELHDVNTDAELVASLDNMNEEEEAKELDAYSKRIMDDFEEMGASNTSPESGYDAESEGSKSYTPPKPS